LHSTYLAYTSSLGEVITRALSLDDHFIIDIQLAVWVNSSAFRVNSEENCGFVRQKSGIW
jgi:hypothetical protein